MKKISPLFILLFSSLLFSQKIPVETVVASMNNRAITYSEILQEGELINIESNVPPETPLKTKTTDLRKQILDLILFRFILFEEARNQEITVSEKEIAQKTETYKKNIHMENFLKKYEITPFEFKTIIKMRLVADKMTKLFLEKRFRGKQPTKEEGTKAVEEWRDNLFKKQKLLIYSMP